MAGKIRAINKSLDEIYNDNVRYSLNTTGGSGTSQVDQIREQHNRLTTSVVDDSVLVGREDEKSDIVKMLTDKTLLSMSSSSSSHHEKISAVSIVGMGGLGKTSLAQLVYQDKSIDIHFDKKMWVCISDNKFDVHSILKKMIESFSDGSCGDLSNMDVDVLARQVKEELAGKEELSIPGKKYLLVLDDLWNEDVQLWEKIKGVLVHGVEGSKLLVTTRNQKVAFIVGGKIHNLQKLTDDVCWSIMQKKISLPLPQNMIHIGKDIAKKCDGLPLAANFLGSLLHLKRNKSYWELINNDDKLWVQPENKRVISILKLSYDNLSFPLRQCFSYCCLFPKDWEIGREILVRLWIAEGFIQLSNEVNTRSYEEIGNEYFEFLLWNSFFQDTVKDEFGGILRCKMHDIVHDLAVSVTDPAEFGIGHKEEKFSQVRHLQLICSSRSFKKTPEVFSKAKKLRTIIALDPKNYSEISCLLSTKRLRVLYPLGGWHAKLSFSIPKLKHLRFLDLSDCEFDSSHNMSLIHCPNLETLILHGCQNVSVFLPEDLGLLKHLRYLDLSSTSITRIPDSITSLSSLKALSLENCSKLVRLPTELGALTCLSCLDLSGTGIQVLPESCISNLCNLEIVNFGECCKLPKEIKNWPKLRIFRHHRNLYHSMRDYDIMPTGIETLTLLEVLDPYMVRREEANIAYSGLEELAVLNSLELLRIGNLENVRGIEDAERAKLQDKTNLRRLYLHWGPNASYWHRDIDEEDEDRENYDKVLEGLQPHPGVTSLKLFRFRGSKFPKWMCSSYLVSLEDICFYDFQNCEKLPALGMLACPRYLEIRNMRSLKCLGREFYYEQQEDQEESTQNSETTTTSPLFPSLLRFWINQMEILEEWVSPHSSVDSFPLLEMLEIRDCTKLRSTPNSFPSLKQLEIHNANGFAVNSILSAGGCLTSLTSIYIGRSPELVYFTLSGILTKHTPNLQSLWMNNCYDLQGFRDHEDDQNNRNSSSSLRVLQFYDCPVLTSIPDIRLWTSLRELNICKCPKLNRESLPYDYKTSLSFIDTLKVDFIQREYQHLPVPGDSIDDLINLMEK